MANRLHGVLVEKLGLVEQGANQEVFFLLKNKEGKESNMPEPTEIKEEVVKEVVKADEGSVEAMVKKMIAMVREMMGNGKMDEMKKSDEPIPESTPDPAITELQKSNEELKKANEETKVELEKQAAELAKQKEDLAKAEQERQTQIYLEKAATFDKLPVAKEDLAKHLQVIGTNTDTLAFVEGLLKAANAAFTDNVMFKEFGTSRIPPKSELADKVEQIQKSENLSYKEALLKLSPEDQVAYLTKRHSEVEK